MGRGGFLGQINSFAAFRYQFMLMVACTVFPLLLPTAATAADWREFGNLNDGMVTVFLDDASVVVEHGSLVKGWVRFDYFSTRVLSGKEVTGHASYRMANCESRRFWVVEDWGRLASTDEQQALNVSTSSWLLPVPDSEDDLALEALCYETRSLLGVLWDKMTVEPDEQ